MPNTRSAPRAALSTPLNWPPSPPRSPAPKPRSTATSPPFENGTLDERTCGNRIRDLTTKLDQLRVRHDDLTELVHTQPSPPSPAAIEQLRRDLAHIVATGTPGQRKAIIETHIAEIKIEGTNLIPVFMIPTNDEGPAETSADPSTTTFRTLVRVVEPRDSHP